jgi:hypothetical protein
VAQPRPPDPRTYDDLVESKTGALRRLFVILCVICLEILQRMAMMDDPTIKPLPSNVLARAIAGDTFGLPTPLAKVLLLCAREMQRFADPRATAPLQIDTPATHTQIAIGSKPTASRPAGAILRPASRPDPRPACSASRQANPHPLRPRPATGPPSCPDFTKPPSPHHIRTPISFRSRNVIPVP